MACWDSLKGETLYNLEPTLNLSIFTTSIGLDTYHVLGPEKSTLSYGASLDHETNTIMTEKYKPNWYLLVLMDFNCSFNYIVLETRYEVFHSEN